MTKSVLFFMLLVFLCGKNRAQIDTSFWFVAPDISAQIGESPITLHIQTYSLPCAVFVRQPALSATAAVNTSVYVNAASVYTIDLTPFITSVESTPVNSVAAHGFYISAKEMVSIYYTIGNQSSTNKEMISLKGRSALGTDFYACMPGASAVLTSSVSDGGFGFDVVATEPGNTLLVVTPLANCIGHPKNIPFLRLLMQGETFSVLDTNRVNSSELAGSIISSNKLIAVTVKGSVRSSSGSCSSNFADQISPSNILGKNYVARKGNSTVDIAYILAPQNATSFTVTNGSGVSPWLINSTESYSINISDPITYVQSDKPVYVFHLSGNGCKLSGAQLAPAFCAGSYETAFMRLSSDSLHLNLLTRNGYQNTFSLTTNGSALTVPASAFSVVPGSANNLVSARLFVPSSSIAVGSYNKISNSQDLFGLSIQNGSSAGGAAYTHASNFEVNTFVYASSVPTATTCANTPFNLSGIIGGGPNTGQWSLVDGYGTFLNPITQYSSNVYFPSLLDTSNNSSSIPIANQYVKIILSSNGICPNKSDTLRLHVLQPPLVNAGSNSVICGNQAGIQFSGDVYGATNQGIWSSLSPASGTFVSGINTFTPYYLLSQNDTVQTLLKFVLTSTNNGACNPGSDTVLVFINKPPIVIANSLASITKCSNNSTVTLNGIVSGTATSTGIWTSSGSGVFSPGNLFLTGNYIPSGNDLLTGSVWLYLRSTNNGICLPTRDSLLVQFIEPAIVNAGSDLNSCNNDPRAYLQGVISGTLTNSILWQGGTGQFLPNNSALTATYVGSAGEIGAGFVTLTLSSTNNGLCFGSNDIIRINYQQKPTAVFTVNPVCYGQLSVFKDQSVNSSTLGTVNYWAWNYGDGSGIDNTSSPSHSYTSTGSFQTTLVVRNNFNCYDTVQQFAAVNMLPIADYTVSRNCSGSAQLIQFKDLSTVSAPDIIPSTGYYWDFGGFGNSYAKDTSLIFPSEGVYSISHVITSDKGCQAVISRTLEITALPVARFIFFNNAQVGLGTTVVFRDTSSNATTWSWNFGNGQTSNIQHPSMNYKENGVYKVRLDITDQFGCPSSYTLDVKIATVVTEIVKLVPNVITPNGDGKNDEWRLDFIDIFFPTAQIEIYNRWGDKIFHSTGYSNAWNGSYKGDPLPVGAYYYTINLNDGVSEVIKGTVSLIK